MNFNERNAHPRDPFLSFDAPSHTYLYNGRELKSVTTLIEEQFPVFDAESAAVRVALREGVSPDEILARWQRDAEQARQLGTVMHDSIERYYLGERKLSADEPDAMRLFSLFADTNRLTPYRTEWRIYHEELGVAGTLDFLEITPNGALVIWDWKRSRKLVEAATGRIIADSRYRVNGLFPVNHLPDTPYWHYALQVSVYRYILEECYDLKISALRLGVFHPAYSVPWVITLPYLRNEVENILKTNHHKILISQS